MRFSECKQDIAKCETFKLKVGADYIELYSIGLKGIAYGFRIRFIDGLLTVMSGRGC